MPRCSINGVAVARRARAVDQDRLGVRGRERQRVGARRALEVAEAEAKHDRPSDPARRPHPPRDPVDDGDERRVDLLRRVSPAPEGALRADRAAPPSGLDPPEVTVVRERVQLTAGRPAEHRDERRLREGGELTDRPHVPRLQPPCGRRADAPHALDRQRMEERELALGRDDEQPVRLRDPAGHLGEELRPRDADGDGQPDALAHGGAQPHRDLRGRARDPLHPAHVEEGLVDRQPLDDGRGSSKTANSPRLASVYAEKRGGTTIASGQRRRACRPPIAVRIPYAFAS